MIFVGLWTIISYIVYVIGASSGNLDDWWRSWWFFDFYGELAFFVVVIVLMSSWRPGRDPDKCVHYSLAALTLTDTRTSHSSSAAIRPSRLSHLLPMLQAALRHFLIASPLLLTRQYDCLSHSALQYLLPGVLLYIRSPMLAIIYRN